MGIIGSFEEGIVRNVVVFRWIVVVCIVFRYFEGGVGIDVELE